MKNARFARFDESTDGYKTVRSLTRYEKDMLLASILDRMGGDRLSDLLAEIAAEATQDRAETILWD